MHQINLCKLLIYSTLKADKILSLGADIINRYNKNEPLEMWENLYYELQSVLLKELNTNIKSSISLWKNHICKLISEDENIFSLTSESLSKSTQFTDYNLSVIVKSDIKIIKLLYNFNWDIINAVYNLSDVSACDLSYKDGEQSYELIHESMAVDDVEISFNKLCHYYICNGCGDFQKHNSFLWDKTLTGIEANDPISFKDLIGYENQKKALIHNTLMFLDGTLSNNVLLYGDKGTGKSSSVKALLNEFKHMKLRIVEIPRDNINTIRDAFNLVKKRGYKFIFFIDDLSFEENETFYKQFKSVLEGGLHKTPDNVLIYATSNRRNLIKETWDERKGTINDVHFGDGLQEKLSLSDRFGLTLTYIAPDKKDFLNIVFGIAKREGLQIDRDTLESEALIWEARHHGRSGRTAVQFINHISGYNKDLVTEEE